MGKLKTGDTVCGIVVQDNDEIKTIIKETGGSSSIFSHNEVCVFIGGRLIIINENELDQKLNRHLSIINNEFVLDNGMVITRDGYIKCPYSKGTLQCSIYLKNKSCKYCFDKSR